MPPLMLSVPSRSLIVEAQGRKLLWLSAALLCLVSGCGHGDAQTPVYPVTGRVIRGDAPVAGALVIFHPASLGAPVDAVLPSARTADDGQFSLSTFGVDDGAPAGEYLITIEWPDVSGVVDEEMAGEGPDRLKGQYSQPATSPWKVTVTDHENQLPAFQLGP